MGEKQFLPLAVVALTAALVAVVAGWTMDRVGRSGTAATEVGAAGKAMEW